MPLLIAWFCPGKGFRFPLAFRCIKGAGGQVPKTLVGIMRIYPILYKERCFSCMIFSYIMACRSFQQNNKTKLAVGCLMAVQL